MNVVEEYASILIVSHGRDEYKAARAMNELSGTGRNPNCHLRFSYPPCSSL